MYPKIYNKYYRKDKYHYKKGKRFEKKLVGGAIIGMNQIDRRKSESQLNHVLLQYEVVDQAGRGQKHYHSFLYHSKKKLVKVIKTIKNKFLKKILNQLIPILINCSFFNKRVVNISQEVQLELERPELMSK